MDENKACQVRRATLDHLATMITAIDPSPEATAGVLAALALAMVSVAMGSLGRENGVEAISVAINAAIERMNNI